MLPRQLQPRIQQRRIRIPDGDDAIAGPNLAGTGRLLLPLLLPTVLLPTALKWTTGNAANLAKTAAAASHLDG